MEEEEAGAVGRRRVYGRLYAVWRAAMGGKGRVVWPLELREAVRETVKKEESEGAAGKYDSQHDCDQSCGGRRREGRVVWCGLWSCARQ
ncbi:hypothetical protein ElyMa_006816500 [Elysia marginata]|uniref:Uncharacterized protein n=1 Tax=Elysia marginata TaxID=1093978 RepID=A0AAV4J5H2_9GAST|nr:hypothetical protein ElyMa_006816500 [Elysia marginata]